MRNRRQLKFFGFLAGVVFLSVFALWRVYYLKIAPTKENIADALRIQGAQQGGQFQRLPDQIELFEGDRRLSVRAEYTIHRELQTEMEGLFKQYSPEYGAFVALDANTGQILSLVSYTANNKKITKDHFALRATFPSASVFKVVTAAAAIAERRFTSSSQIKFQGRAHTLYRRQILESEPRGWLRSMSLKEAFGKSVNSVFGRLGVFNLGPGVVRDYAKRFGFNRAIASDLPIESGRAEISEDPYELAEATSGFTQRNTMSPLQGALIAAAIVNGGLMVEPYAIQRLMNSKDEVVYESEGSSISKRVLPERVIPEMKELMAHTVTMGTSRQSFRGFHRSKYAVVNVGGKTGSLTGSHPIGKYDWFIGYGSYKNRKIALATLTIHDKYWTVKSAHLARRAIENYFKPFIK